jgi:sulfur carrier protein
VLVKLRNPPRQVQIRGPVSVVKVLGELDLARESVLVIRNGTLVPGDAVLADDDEVEIRPVISGGAAELLSREHRAAELLSREHRP